MAWHGGKCGRRTTRPTSVSCGWWKYPWALEGESTQISPTSSSPEGRGGRKGRGEDEGWMEQEA